MIDTNVAAKFVYSIWNTPMRVFPFPHFISQEIFPTEFYSELVGNLPPKESYRAITESGRITYDDDYNGDDPYENRLSMDLTADSIVKFPPETNSFWKDFIDFINGNEFLNYVLRKFEPSLSERYHNLEKVSFRPHTQLIRDLSGYEIGPHTDHKKKVAVLLIYLPCQSGYEGLGTSIYIPKNFDFTCEGGPHYCKEEFDLVFTAPYLPNTAFGFFKTNNSFHGVEPVIQAGAERNLIQYSILEV